MHKSFKKKHSRLFLSAPSLTNKNLSFFYWKPATAPRGGGGGASIAPLSLPLNDIFSQKLAF